MGIIDEDNTLALQNGALVRFKPAECIETYQNPLQSRYRSVILVVNGTSTNNSVLSYTQSSPMSNRATDWIFSFLPRSLDCLEGRNHSKCTKKATKRSNAWFVLNRLVKYCKVKTVEGKCKLQFSITIMAVVIVCNVAKLMCMVYAIFNIKEDTLVTVGDAISSFLGNPERRTKSLCLISKKPITQRAAIASTCQRRQTIEESLGIQKSLVIGRAPEPPLSNTFEPQSYNPSGQFWFSAPSPLRWLIFIAIIASALAMSTLVLKRVMGQDF